MSDLLREAQLSVLSANTVESELSGLLGRYNRALEEHLRGLIGEAYTPDSPHEEAYLRRAEEVYGLLGASALIAFNLQHGNMVGSLSVLMVDERTTQAIPGSEVSIASICGPSYRKISEPFTDQDAAFAASRLSPQRDVALIYGLSRGHGYLVGY